MELPKHKAQSDQIECVSMEMSAAYQKGCRENCPHAEVVFARFYMMQNVGKAVDQVRRR